ncbi:MAG TPA: GH-E family nuclease, partial [Thermoanaerobaculia bacterium]|nr:GH-E family nuclease [Thermoanaerobaculia bacterium]
MTAEELLASEEVEQDLGEMLHGFWSDTSSMVSDDEAGSGAASSSDGGGARDKRFERPGWRRRRVVELRIEAGGSSTAPFGCPTCDTMMTGAKVQRGSRFFVDFDIDHTMMTHARRVELIQFTETNPRFQGRTFTRQEFRDIYHDSLRLQCPACNRSHRFEPTSWDEAVYTWVFASERIPYFAPY